MSKTTQTSRRTFLKAGALVAAPAAAVGIPVAALAEDGSKAALARLQDERAIEGLNREFLRAFNHGGAESTARLFADGRAPDLSAQISRLSLADEAAQFSLDSNGATATASFACTVETAEDFEGSDTLVQMARLQGNAADVVTSRKQLSARYAKRADGWLLTEVAIA